MPDAGARPTSPDAAPRVPQQIGVVFGVDLSVSGMHPGLSNGGGTFGVSAGINDQGPFLTTYSSPPGGSTGVSFGGNIGVTVSVGSPTSAPSNVIGGNIGNVGASVSHTPGEGGGPGAIGFGLGFSPGLPLGFYATQTVARPGEEPPVLDGGQCIEGDLDGDGHLSEAELKKLSEY